MRMVLLVISFGIRNEGAELVAGGHAVQALSETV